MGEEENVYTSGNVRISEDVIVSIVSIAADEVEGVSIAGSTAREYVERLTKKGTGKGVRITKEEDTVTADVSIIVEYGYNIREVAVAVQDKVKTAVESMTMLKVGAVNVTVTGIGADKDKKSE